MKNLAFIICFAFLSGCVMQVSSPQQSSNGTSIQFDQYAGRYLVEGLHLDTGDFPNITKFWLSGAFDKQGNDDGFQIIIQHWSQTGWLFLSDSSDSDAVHIPVSVMSRDVGTDGNVTEIVSLSVSHDYLASHLKSGIDIRVVGSKGSVIIKQNGMYLAGFLTKYDALKIEKIVK